MSLPSWERGLKLGHGAREVTQVRSLPSWERGLKHVLISGHGQEERRRSLRGSVD